MQNAEQIRTAPGGDILVAPKGSAFPDDIADAFSGFGPEWDVLGFATDDGVEMTPTKQTGDVPVWQSAAPGKYFVQSAAFSLGYSLVQTNAKVFRHYFGASWTLTAGTAKMIIESNPDLDEMMMAVRWIGDNTSTNLMIVERGMVTDRQSMKLSRTAAVVSGLTFSAMDFQGRLAQLLTDDPEIIAELEAS